MGFDLPSTVIELKEVLKYLVTTDLRPNEPVRFIAHADLHCSIKCLILNNSLD